MMLRLALVTAIVVVATLAGRWWQARQGRMRSVQEPSPTSLAVPVVTSATLVSTPTCRTCPQVRRALDLVAAGHEPFRWDEVDASDDVDFVRRHDVRRAPTVLFRDAGGRVVARAAGQVDAHQVGRVVRAGVPVTTS